MTDDVESLASLTDDGGLAIGLTGDDADAADAADRGSRRWGRVALFGGVVVGFTLLVGPFVSPGLRRHSLPYIPATTEQVRDALSLTKEAVQLLGLPRRARVVDLGSGDGRVVLEAAKQLQVNGEGIEMNRWLVLYSSFAAWRAGMHESVSFRTGDLFKVNLGSYDVVYLFLGSGMMSEIEEKLERDMASRRAAVITTRFGLPNWKPRRREGLATLYVSPQLEKSLVETETKD